MKIRCLIVDDEPYAVNLLAEYIAQVSWLSLEHKCYNALEALDYLKNHTVELVFLDINMPQLSGMQLTALLPAGQLFIFTTAYSEFAVESYEKNAVDYLLKPITFDRFLKAVNRAAQLLQSPAAKQTADSHKLFLKTGKTIVQLQYHDVIFVEGLKDYVVFHTLQGKHVVYKRMKELEETLPAQFSRVHNSYIINHDHIQKIEDNHVCIGDNRVPVSEKYKAGFFDKVNHRLL
jgi:two-component system, LytTR family, response regulator